jgi:hypothetical protein
VWVKALGSADNVPCYFNVSHYGSLIRPDTVPYIAFWLWVLRLESVAIGLSGGAHCSSRRHVSLPNRPYPPSSRHRTSRMHRPLNAAVPPVIKRPARTLVTARQIEDCLQHGATPVAGPREGFQSANKVFGVPTTLRPHQVSEF